MADVIIASNLHIGDIGTVFELTVREYGTTMAVPLNGASTKQWKVKRPDGTTYTSTAAFLTDGTDGVVKYTALSGHLNQEGWYTIQGYFVIPSGEWRTDYGKFKVLPNLT